MEDKTGQRMEGDSLERSVCGKDTGPVTDSVLYPISSKEFSANEGAIMCLSKPGGSEGQGVLRVPKEWQQPNGGGARL